MAAFKLAVGSSSNNAANKVNIPPLSVRISKITTYGEVTLEFSNQMIAPPLDMIQNATVALPASASTIK